MKPIYLLLTSFLFVTACGSQNEDFLEVLGDNCEQQNQILSPPGYELSTIGEIGFSGSIRSFQFVNDQTGYILAHRQIGGYVEVLKTTDGGKVWDTLDLSFDLHPVSMVFKDENIGLITTRKTENCTPLGCLLRTIILSTENGGRNWKEVAFNEFEGSLYHLQYDDTGNLFAVLSFEEDFKILKSEDDGVHWEVFVTSEELGFTLISFSFSLFEGGILAAGKGGQLLLIDQNGDIQSSVELPNDNIWDLEVIDRNHWIVALSGSVLSTTNGGRTLETIHNQSGRLVGFESAYEGLAILRKSSCPNDVYQVNDLLASTVNGGLVWDESPVTTTNLGASYIGSQQMSPGIWRLVMDDYLFEIRRN